MFIARNKDGHLIDVEEAERSGEYRCPACNAPVIIRDGLVNATHFAHAVGNCTDNWNYDMSEWHRRIQNFFPKEAREIVVEKEGKKHRADILMEKTVIEIQHSPISTEEFVDRNFFFHSLGYRIAWIFDVSQQYESKRLYFSSVENSFLMTWKYPLRVLSEGERPTDNNSRYSIWLFMGYEQEDYIIDKVIGSTENDNNKPCFKRIQVSEYSIYLNKLFKIDDFFTSTEDRIKDEIRILKETHDFSIKYSGVEGKPRMAYVCPLTGKFGIKICGDRNCSYCRYCYMILQKKRMEGKTMIAVYCCYPEQVQEIDQEDQDYECSQIPVYRINNYF